MAYDFTPSAFNAEIARLEGWTQIDEFGLEGLAPNAKIPARVPNYWDCDSDAFDLLRRHQDNKEFMRLLRTVGMAGLHSRSILRAFYQSFEGRVVQVGRPYSSI